MIHAHTTPRKWVVGDAVIIADHSDARGDKGRVWAVQPNGIILVALDQGCIWPVTADELQENGGA
jgi:hypothetical protein